MTKTMICAAILLSAATTAHADKSVGEQLGSDMEAYANIEANLGDSTSYETLTDERKSYGAECDALVAKAKKKLKADDELIAWRLGDHPKARKVGDKYAVKVSDAAWFCDRYRQRLDELAIRFMLDAAKSDQTVVDQGFTDDQKKDIRSGGNDARKQGEECEALVAKMTDAGVAADLKITSQRGTSTTFGEMPAMCQAFSKYANLRDAEWKVLAVEFEKPFRDAGITGDRLDWFVYYGPGIEVWYLKGYKGSTSLAKIKKAKLLFQWLTDSDGVVTIRRFQFKGDKLVKQTDKQYATEKKAYKGCK